MKKQGLLLLAFLGINLYVNAQGKKHVWQIEASYDYMTHGDPLAFQVLFTDFSELIVANSEKATFFLAVSRLSPIKGLFSFRYGLSFSDKGYLQDFGMVNPNVGTFWRIQTNRQHHYLGIPLLVSYNSTGTKNRLSGFAEAGLLPEILLGFNKRHELAEAEILEYDFRRLAISAMFSAGLQYRLSESLMVFAGPQVRLSLMDYDTGNSYSPISSIQAAFGYRPFSIGFAGGIRF